MADAEPKQLGRYRILAELGRGAMGVVYRAEDPLLNRTVAVKTIVMEGDTEERKEYEARFYQEARAAGGLSHPNLIIIHDIGREGDTAYMAMELLDGVELRELIKQGRVPLAQALELAAQVADGLAYAHERGVVHRDIKPANVMVIGGRHAKIMDFGIARMRISDVKTQAGAVLGSPKYMSPEQVTGLRADHRSDIFSLGIVLYELVCGAAPFSAESVTGLMHNIATVSHQPPTAVDPSLPSMLDLITAKALQKDPEWRYQSATELAADLRACLGRLGEGATGSAAETQEASAPLEKTAVIAMEAQAAAIAKADAETRVDVPLSDTTVAGQATTVSARQVERTRKTDAAAPPGVAGPVSQLYLSRKVDSREAMKRLEAMTVSGENGNEAVSSHGAPGWLGRWWADGDQRVVALVIAAAVVCAVVIATL